MSLVVYEIGSPYHRSSIVYDIYETVRVLNYVLPGEAASPGDTQAERVQRVLACQERLEKRFLRHLDMSIAFHCMCSLPQKSHLSLSMLRLCKPKLCLTRFFMRPLTCPISWSFMSGRSLTLQRGGQDGRRLHSGLSMAICIPPAAAKTKFWGRDATSQRSASRSRDPREVEDVSYPSGYRFVPLAL